jgi:hypothetical protein
MTQNVHPLFSNPSTIWTAAEVFSDIAEWSPLLKTTSDTLTEIISNGIVQESSRLYVNGSIGLDSMTAIASLAITISEIDMKALIYPLPATNEKLLETMLYLLNSDLSLHTFNFWIEFAEASLDVDDGHRGDVWLQRALQILLEKSAWRDDVDQEEWTAYRMDVADVFESICEVLGYETMNSLMASYLENAGQREDIQERASVLLLRVVLIVSQVLEATLFFLSSVRQEFKLADVIQQNLFPWIFEILEVTAIDPDLAILLRKTGLTFFGTSVISSLMT